MLYMGFDQHGKQVTASERRESGTVSYCRHISTQWDRMRDYLADLQRRSAADGGYLAIVEVCGFNDWFIKLLGEYGCREVVLVQPEKRSKHKTDRRDANTLSEVLWVNRTRLLAGQRVQGIRRIVPPSPQHAEDRQLTAWRQRIGRQRTRTINAVQHILLKHNLQQECPTKGLQTIQARAWLRRLALDTIDRLQLDQLLDQWDLWDRQFAEVEAKLKERQREDDDAVVLSTTPGIAAYSSVALSSRISGIERFRRPQSLGNYWGLTPSSRNSGENNKRLGSITKEGSAIARFLLGQITTHVLKKDKGMREWHKRIKRRRSSKIARVAVMRRLTEIFWYMLTYRVPYDSDPARLKATCREKALAKTG